MAQISPWPAMDRSNFFFSHFFLVRGLGNKNVTHGPVLIEDANT